MNHLNFFVQTNDKRLSYTIPKQPCHIVLKFVAITNWIVEHLFIICWRVVALSLSVLNLTGAPPLYFLEVLCSPVYSSGIVDYKSRPSNRPIGIQFGVAWLTSALYPCDYLVWFYGIPTATLQLQLHCKIKKNRCIKPFVRFTAVLHLVWVTGFENNPSDIVFRRKFKYLA